MSTHRAETDSHDSSTQAAETVDPTRFPAQYAQTLAPPPPARRPLSQRPFAIVLLVLGGLVASALFLLLVVAPFIYGFTNSVRSLEMVMLDDFATAGDAPMREQVGLSWDQSDGTLNLYPTDSDRSTLEFVLPDGANALRVDADFIASGSRSDPEFVWGLAAYNRSSREGVALMCQSGGTMFLADMRTGDPLPAAGSDFTCQENMSMSLDVRDRLVNYGPTAENYTLYVGNELYSDLDAVGVVVAAAEPDQVLRVAKIEAYQ
jgi:hypothetical protein